MVTYEFTSQHPTVARTRRSRIPYTLWPHPLPHRTSLSLSSANGIGFLLESALFGTSTCTWLELQPVSAVMKKLKAFFVKQGYVYNTLD